VSSAVEGTLAAAIESLDSVITNAKSRQSTVAVVDVHALSAAASTTESSQNVLQAPCGGAPNDVNDQSRSASSTMADTLRWRLSPDVDVVVVC